MSQGLSGRMVVELEPALKRRLYASLASDGLTFKQWLIRQADAYLSQRRQPLLFAAEPPTPNYVKESAK
jgi:hypothetical protein